MTERSEEQILADAKEIFGDVLVGIENPDGVQSENVFLIRVPESGYTENGITLLFSNGKRVRISTSEWANIQAIREGG